MRIQKDALGPTEGVTLHSDDAAATDMERCCGAHAHGPLGGSRMHAETRFLPG